MAQIRRPWWWLGSLGVLAAVAGMIVVAAAINDSERTGGVVAVESPTTLPHTSPSPTSTSASTVQPPATAEAAPTTQLTPVDAIPPPVFADPTQVMPPNVSLLVAHPDGIDIWNADGTTPLLTGVDVLRAYPDGQGGVIYQERWTQEHAAAASSPPIMRIAAPGALPEVYIEPGTSVGLQDVSSTTVAYSVFVPNEENCPGELCVSESSWDLVFRDQASGTERRVEYWADWEQSAFSFELGGSLVATEYSDYDPQPPCLGVFSLDDLIANAHGEDELCPLRPEPCPEASEWGECHWYLGAAAVAPDDTTVAYVWADGEAHHPYIVVRDSTTLEERRRVAIELNPGDGFYIEELDVTDDGWITARGHLLCAAAPCAPSVALLSPDNVSSMFPVPFAVIWSTGDDE